MRVVFVTREVWPFVKAGGIGRYISDAVAALAGRAEVTVLTSDRCEPGYRELAAAGDPRLGSASWRFAPDPADGDLSPFWTNHHAWSAGAYAAVRALSLEERPDIVEFEDYGGSAAVTLHAARAGDPALRDVRLLVRGHTSWEMTQVLDAQPLDGLAARTVMALERDSLRLADGLLAPAGTLEAYRRHYGTAGLAPGIDSPLPIRTAESAPEDRDPPIADRFRVLYLGRMQRFKGTQDLVRAMGLVSRDDIELTLVGGDTDTGPLGGSMLEHLKALSAGDPRITFRDRVERAEVDRLIREHHIVVVPSRFESFSYVLREALAANRPVLAANTGGAASGFVPGRSGWLIRPAAPEELARSLQQLAGDREAVETLIRDGAPRATLDAAANAETYAKTMLGLAAEPSRPKPAQAEPLAPVTAIVTACDGEGPLEDTLSTLEAQRHAGLEIVVAAEHVDLVPARALGRIHALTLLEDGVTGANAARAAALAARRGTGPVLLIRSGERLAPGFLARALAALAGDPALAYVTAYAQGKSPACVPLGNAGALLVGEYDVAATVAVLRDDALPLGPPPEPGRDDRSLYAALADAGRFGIVIPEPLVTHRLVRRDGDVDRAAKGLWETLSRGAVFSGTDA